jgi:hypothetical protein
MHKLLSIAAIPAAHFVIACAIAFIPSVASARWVKIYENPVDRSTISYEDQKIIKDGNKVYYWYRTNYTYLSPGQPTRVDLKVAADCSTRTQKLLRAVRYGSRNQVIDRISWENEDNNPSASVVRLGNVDEIIANEICNF